MPEKLLTQLFWAIIATGAALPWLMGLVVRTILEAQGKPVAPISYFVGNPGSIVISLLITLVFAFPFIYLAFLAKLWLAPKADDRGNKFFTNLIKVLGGFFGAVVFSAISYYDFWQNVESISYVFLAPRFVVLPGFLGTYIGIGATGLVLGLGRMKDATQSGGMVCASLGLYIYFYIEPGVIVAALVLVGITLLVFGLFVQIGPEAWLWLPWARHRLIEGEKVYARVLAYWIRDFEVVVGRLTATPSGVFFTPYYHPLRNLLGTQSSPFKIPYEEIHDVDVIVAEEAKDILQNRIKLRTQSGTEYVFDVAPNEKKRVLNLIRANLGKG